MGLIVSEVYDALIEAGTSPEKATAAAAAVPLAENVATKDDIARIDANIAGIRVEMAGIRAEMATKDDIARIDASMATKQDLAEASMVAKQNLDESNLAIKRQLTKIEKDVAVLKLAVFGGGSVMMGALGTLLKLALFP